MQYQRGKILEIVKLSTSIWVFFSFFAHMLVNFNSHGFKDSLF